jgi:hypothetical protein
VVKPRQPLCGLVLSDTIFRIFESTAVAGSGVLALLLELPLVQFNRGWANSASVEAADPSRALSRHLLSVHHKDEKQT